MVTADGQGGVFIGWRDARNFSLNDYDVYGQHLTGSGTLFPGCPAGGIPICASPLTQYFGVIVPDGSGGAYYGFFDDRIPGGGYSVTPLVQRITASGAPAPGWVENGTPIAPIGSADDNIWLAPDGSGGVLCVWDDTRYSSSPDIFAQHLTPAGVPAPGWPTTGLPIAVYPGYQYAYTVLGDGAGGMVACWGDPRPGAPGIYLQHVQGDGTLAAGWPGGGLRVAQDRGTFGMVPDGSGGFYIGLFTSSNVYQNDSTYYILRVDGLGQKVAGWADNGTLVCSAPDVRGYPHLAADAAGRVFLSWEDYRSGGLAVLYLAALMPDGTLAPGWVANGEPISTYPAYQQNGDLLADGSGGVWLCGTFSAQSGSYAFIQHVGANGTPAPGWDASGATLYPQGLQESPRLAPDGTGGAIVVWYNGAVGYGYIYAQRFPGETPTATLLSLVSADARPDRVSLLWDGPGAGTLTATVERHTSSTDWTMVGSPAPDGPDRLRYDDHDVIAATRYGYRLGYVLAGQRLTTAEAWVDVPASVQFALDGPRPNPAVGTNLQISFALPGAGPATLELIDLAGRRLAAREVGSLGAGAHLEPLQPATRVAPGLYWLRLTQGSHSLVAKAVVAR